jgi:hypothetical protein
MTKLMFSFMAFVTTLTLFSTSSIAQDGGICLGTVKLESGKSFTFQTADENSSLSQLFNGVTQLSKYPAEAGKTVGGTLGGMRVSLKQGEESAVLSVSKGQRKGSLTLPSNFDTSFAMFLSKDASSFAKNKYTSTLMLDFEKGIVYSAQYLKKGKKKFVLSLKEVGSISECSDDSDTDDDSDSNDEE